MKHIMAFVRTPMAEHVVDALTREGCLDFLFAEVQRIIPGLAREAYSYSVQLGQGFEPMLRLDLVCRDEDSERYVESIRSAARTGVHGDGMIFVGDIQEAVRIRTGERGESTLQGRPGPGQGPGPG